MKSLKPAKQKAVNFKLIPETDDGHTPEPYLIMREMMEKFHEDLHGAKIALAWRIALKADKDGHLMLGKCVKASDLQKEFAEYDFVILLNREVWMSDEFTPEKKRALVDHELCHATFAPDKDGFKKRDERDRIVWRMRKHDIEEFFDVVRRHGCYKRDLQAFAEAVLKKKTMPPLVAAMEESKPNEHVIVITKKTADLIGDSDSKTRRARKRMQGQDAILPDPRKPGDPPSPGAQA